MDFIYILLTLILILVVSLILYARWNYGVLEGLGIPVVKPHFLLGSSWNVNNEVTAEEDVKRFRKYGKVYGFYEGREPQIHICDPDVIKSILIKDFDHFNGRRTIDFGSPLFNELPGFVADPAKWKFLRTLMTPTLTPTKIKGMSNRMVETLNDFAEDLNWKINENCGQAITLDFKQAIFTMLTDMITRCMFNIKITNGNDPENYFARIVKRLVEGGTDDDGGAGMKPNPLFPYSLSFPFLKRFIPPIFNPNAGDDFEKTLKEILKTHKLTESKSDKDYIQTLSKWMDKLDTSDFQNVGIKEQTILCQALITFFGGQDQISTTIAYMFYEIAKNPQIKQKLYEEIDEFLIRYNNTIMYENLQELPYLLACITESIRLISFFIRAERVCTKSWEGHGLKIPKGTTVIIPIWAANRNPEYFPNPKEFNPERFMPENKAGLHPCSFTSFGFGPRNCIGQKIAFDIMLLTGAVICKGFYFKRNEGTKSVDILPGSLIMARTNPIYLDVSPRK